MPIRARIHTKLRTVAAVLSLGALLCACGGGGGNEGSGSEAISPAPPTPPVAMFRSLGSQQCTGGGLTLASLVQTLTSAGVTVAGSSCGNDGLARIALCGAPDGRIGIVDVAQSQTAGATALGFALLSELPSATRTACP